MLQTSQDLFLIIAAIAIVWVAVFLCWALYRLAMFLKTATAITDDVHQKIETFDEWLDAVRERLGRAVAVATTLQKAVETALSVISRTTSKKSVHRASKKSAEIPVEEEE